MTRLPHYAAAAIAMLTVLHFADRIGFGLAMTGAF